MGKYTITIDAEKCAGCGECTKVCPGGLFVIEDGRSKVGPTEHCIGCGHCFAVCPAGAVKFNDADPDAAAPSFDGDNRRVKYDDLASLVQSRRATRNFKADTPVPRAVLEEIFETCKYAPTACNALSNSFAVVSDAATLAEIRKLTRDAIRSAPGMEKKAEMIPDALLCGGSQLLISCGPKAMSLAVDHVIAAETFELLAQAKGLGTCWAGFITAAINQYPPLRAFLKEKGVDLENRAACALMIGYPETSYARVPPRPSLPTTWI